MTTLAVIENPISAKRLKELIAAATPVALFGGGPVVVISGPETYHRERVFYRFERLDNGLSRLLVPTIVEGDDGQVCRFPDAKLGSADFALEVSSDGCFVLYDSEVIAELVPQLGPGHGRNFRFRSVPENSWNTRLRRAHGTIGFECPLRAVRALGFNHAAASATVAASVLKPLEDACPVHVLQES
jgi:hypothetical protein